MQQQSYEEYWKLTNAFTDYNGKKFLDTLAVCVKFIDDFNDEPYSEDKYNRLQLEIEKVNHINLISIRKSINQLQEECEEFYGNPICILEKLTYPILIASHIKPFIESNEIEAYDPNNGLLLSRTIDSLFDLKYISFSDEGKIIFSKRLSNDVVEFWKNYTLDEYILNEQRCKYLEYHRKLLIKIDAAA